MAVPDHVFSEKAIKWCRRSAVTAAYLSVRRGTAGSRQGSCGNARGKLADALLWGRQERRGGAGMENGATQEAPDVGTSCQLEGGVVPGFEGRANGRASRASAGAYSGTWSCGMCPAATTTDMGGGARRTVQRAGFQGRTGGNLDGRQRDHGAPQIGHRWKSRCSRVWIGVGTAGS